MKNFLQDYKMLLLFQSKGYWVRSNEILLSLLAWVGTAQVVTAIIVFYLVIYS